MAASEHNFPARTSSIEMNDQPIHPYLLLVTIGKSPGMFIRKDSGLTAEVHIDNRVYRDTGKGDWIGFYDWLRTEAGEVVGVRFSPTAGNSDVVEALLNAPVEYVVPDSGAKAAIIYFCTERRYCNETSNDQAFGSNRLFRSLRDDILMTFGIDKTLLEKLRKISRMEI